MGGGKTRTAIVLAALNAARGTAYDVGPLSNVYAENLAYARAIANAWSANQRLANINLPRKMTTTLPRWERICGIIPAAGDDLGTRRAHLQKLFERIGKLFNRARLETIIAEELGAVFLAIYYIPLSAAVITVPDGSYPFGAPSSESPWSSNACKVLVHVRRPPQYTEGDFADAVGKLAPLMDGVLPAWVVWDWYRSPSPGTPVNVPGGPQGAGFFLDDDRNLDFEIFDV